MDIKRFRKLPLLGIVRGIAIEAIEPLVETAVASGLQSIEITMNTKNAPALIRKMSAVAGDGLMVGAGTVLTMEELHQALDAGATFIVMPILVPPVVSYCKSNNIPVFPGALTPGEIHDAWRCGATMVKVFPSTFFGPAYFKEIKGPFQDIELLACGGITPENVSSFLSSGASAVAFGGSVFKKEWLEKHDFSEIGNKIRAFVQNIEKSPHP
ncbi:MAG: bifunctional 4-hydroxy-2-oxoglutarate aldolase/2-dehydro-3-deoxy-phosphogluconate aldolase [Proteobacteria bacterium]|nr:bifunctional 4-hydroxy-2-oxoglutarate aldolase/2-dehydro-3-deoxy-phosphogluconate aldolase [Pseudomonadota bacterium]